jgi:hypothetical protein
MRNLMILLLTQYCVGNKIEKNEMGRVCSMDVEGRGVYWVLVGNLNERDHWGEQAYIGG